MSRWRPPSSPNASPALLPLIRRLWPRQLVACWFVILRRQPSTSPVRARPRLCLFFSGGSLWTVAPQSSSLQAFSFLCCPAPVRVPGGPEEKIGIPPCCTLEAFPPDPHLGIFSSRPSAGRAGDWSGGGQETGGEEGRRPEGTQLDTGGGGSAGYRRRRQAQETGSGGGCGKDDHLSLIRRHVIPRVDLECSGCGNGGGVDFDGGGQLSLIRHLLLDEADQSKGGRTSRLSTAAVPSGSVVIMDSNIEVEHEEELDFQLEVNEDASSEDDNMPSDGNPALETRPDWM